MSLKSWMLRRAMGRLRITDDIDWIWPHAAGNVTPRNWTSVGTVASTKKGIVDPRGLLTPWFDGWSLDWWIGAEDRWHVPAREAAVRQFLVADTPVVETAMRVPGGDAVQRVYAVAGDEPLAVMEITNRTPTPFAVALAVRPYNPEGLAVVEEVGLHERTVTVDGRPALLLPKRPQRMAASTFHDGDASATVFAGAAGTEFPQRLRCEAGLATAAFLFPLAHAATLRVAVPLDAGRRTRRRGVARRRVQRAPDVGDKLPTSDAAVKGWQAQTAGRGMRLVLPEGRLASAVEANRRYLLLFHEGADVTVLDRYGFHRESGEVIRHFPARQRVDGAALYAMAEHWRLTGSLEDIDIDGVAKGVRWIERKRQSKRHRSDPALAVWSLRGLLDGATLLRAAGRDDSADEATSSAQSLREALVASMGAGFLQLASVELAAGDPRCLERLAWMLEMATPTYTWPEAIHPGLGGGCMGDGHHGRAAADFLSLVRNLLVREVEGGLALCSMLPDAWTGKNLEVHDAPTAVGVLSFAVRWHGNRPALLWDLRPHEHRNEPVRLRAPGLDPRWSTTEAKGEVLLGASTAAVDADAAAVPPAGSFS